LHNILLASLVMVFLSACGSSTVSSPSQTAIPITLATNTLTPTLSPSPTLTPSPTVVPIPEFMKEFIELGYDKQPFTGGSIHVVLDENATFYASDLWGLKYKKSILYGWTKVHYIDNGVLQTHLVLNDFCTETPTSTNSYYCYITWSDNIRISNNDQLHTTQFTNSQMNFVHEHSVGEYPIVQIEFESAYFDAHNDFSKTPNFSFFQDLYPTFTGQFATFEIPTIGTFLPVTHVEYDFSEGKWIQNP
jgi:hypothetical protein